MKSLKSVFILLVVFLLASFNVMASAGGGMEGKPDNSYVTVPDGTCITISVEGIDLEKCTLSPSSPQSGLQSWICPPPEVGDEPVVVCSDVKVEDEEEDK